MGSAAETEIRAYYKNGTADIPTQVALIEMGHPQPPTPMQLYNTTAVNCEDDELKKTYKSYQREVLLDKRQN